MFLSVILPLTALNLPAPSAPRFLGREAHALFLDLVRRADPALAQSLHEPRGDKPFTVAYLSSHPQPPLPSPNEVRSGEGRGGRGSGVRFTAFEPRLVQLLAQSILPNLPREIRLGSATFAVGAPITDRAAHPWAGTTSAEALMSKWFASPTSPPTPLLQGEGSSTSHPPPLLQGEGSDARDDSPSPLRRGGRGERFDRVMLDFATPTAHRQIHRNILFPLPTQMWGGWLRAWNAFAQPAFEDDLIARVEQDVAISNYALKTQVVDFGEYRAAGWVGRATFNYFSRERALWRVLNLLADFAFFCGTGYKTTQGMGMTRRIG